MQATLRRVRFDFIAWTSQLLAVVVTLVLLAASAGTAVAATTYTYDTLSRLIGVNFGNGTTISYTYDAAGNRTSVLTSGALGTNNDLASLSVSGATLSPGFSTGVLNYNALVNNGVTSITVTPTLAEGTASVRVNGVLVASGNPSSSINLNVGPNAITVLVTAENGATRTYNINVFRAAPPTFRAYLSVNGNDGNPCTAQLPCRLLPAALAAATDGGEVWILTSANYNTGPVDITKSVTVLAVPGVVGSVVGSGGDAITIGTAGVHVTLRNLVVLNFGGGVNGINFTNGAELTVESCEIYGMGDSGLRATATGAALTVRDSVIRDNAAYGAYVAGSTSATLRGVQLLNNASAGLFAGGNAEATLTNGVVANNGTFGVTAQATGGTTTKLTVESSVLRSNAGAGLEGFANGAGDAAEVVAIGNSITHNGTGVLASSNAGATVRIVLGGNAITNNTTGVSLSGAGSRTVYTRQTNSAKDNGTDVSGGSLTPLSGL